VDVVIAVEKCVVLTSSWQADGYADVSRRKKKKETLDKEWPESM
jgi:hypothetical protein